MTNIDNDLMTRMVEAAAQAPAPPSALSSGVGRWPGVDDSTLHTIITAAIRAGNLVPAEDQAPNPTALANVDLLAQFGAAAADLLTARAEAADRTAYAAELEERCARAEREAALTAAIRTGNLVPAQATAHDQLEHWAGPDAGDGTVPRDEVLAVMGRTIRDLRDQFGSAANIVAHAQDALRVAGYIHQSASGDQPPRPNELADCIRALHESVTRAERERDEAEVTLDRIHAVFGRRAATTDWEGLVRAVEQTAAQLADRTSYAAELEERVAGLERGAKVREMEERIDAQAGALTAVHNILIRNGSLASPDLIGVVQGVATELERRDERVKELEQQLSALTEAAASRDKVSRMVADLRDHSLHGQLEALQAEELRLLRLVARLVDGGAP